MSKSPRNVKRYMYSSMCTHNTCADKPDARDNIKIVPEWATTQTAQPLHPLHVHAAV